MLFRSNGDGKLDAADAHFKDLRVWVDANHDGKTEAGELKTLDELHIAALDLHGLAGTHTDHGNLLGLTSSYTTTDGASHDMADVWFAKDTTSDGATHAAPNLHELLAGPSVDLLGSHPATAPEHHAPADPSTTSAHLLAHALDASRRGEDESHWHGPLI